MKKFIPTLLALSFTSFAFGDYDFEEGQAVEKKTVRKSPVVKAAFSPFTGRIGGENVRVRLQPDLDGHVARQLHRDELVVVVGQEGEYWCVEAPDGVKAYVFRSFILDNVVEGNRVNIRLEPDLESPIIGHFNTGDQVSGVVSQDNRKWLEINPPASAKFYIAKEFIEHAGGPEFKQEMEKKVAAATHALNEAHSQFSKIADLEYEQIDFDGLKAAFDSIVASYPELPNQVADAKKGLEKVQESYLVKRIAYLEQKASVANASIEKTQEENRPLNTSQRLARWEPLEEAIYLSWAHSNGGKSMEEFYEDKRIHGKHLTGSLHAFASSVKNKPGDFILKSEGRTVAYLYSTGIDLNQYEGRQVTMIGSERPNNHFAFPTYYVHSIE